MCGFIITNLSNSDLTSANFYVKHRGQDGTKLTEFAIVLYDSTKQVMRLYTDVFGTKPLHYGINERDFAVASYASAIYSLGFETALKVPANTLVEISTRDGSLHVQSGLFEFSLDQYKDGFSEWDAAFTESIAKRTRNIQEQIFIGLSSGYDSGGIACELNAQGVNYKSYSLLGNEDKKILEERMRIIAEHSQSELMWLGHLE